MKTKLTILLFFIFFSQILLGNHECRCENDQEIARVHHHAGNGMLVCGDFQSRDSALVYGLSIVDCQNGEYLYDNRFFEAIPDSIIVYDDSIELISFHLAPVGDEWVQKLFPFTLTTFRFRNGKVISSESRNIFEYPELTPSQIDSIEQICKKLEAFPGNKEFFYPLDYETLYVLFVGALKDIATSRQMFRQIPQKFILDGAAASTYSEIHFDHIVDDSAD